MSLINDALRKAQAPQAARPNIPDIEMPAPPQPKKKRRGPLGCLLTMMISSLVMFVVTMAFSGLFISYLSESDGSLLSWMEERISLMKDSPIPSESAPETPAQAQQDPAQTPAEQPEPVVTSLPAEQPRQEPESSVTTEPVLSTQSQPEPEPEPEPEPAPEPIVTVEAAPVTQATPLPTPVPQPARPAEADPAIITRVLALQIRGVMSGNSRVLIFDPTSGRTRSYEIDQIIEGIHPLTIREISPDKLTLEDNDGFLHHKRF